MLTLAAWTRTDDHLILRIHTQLLHALYERQVGAAAAAGEVPPQVSHQLLAIQPQCTRTHPSARANPVSTFDGRGHR